MSLCLDVLEANTPTRFPFCNSSTRRSNFEALFIRCNSSVIMKITAGVAFLAALTAGTSAGAPTPPNTPTPGQDFDYFTVISSKPGSPLHLLTLSARNGKFYLGGGSRPTTYCPTEAQQSCPPGTATVFDNGYNLFDLAVLASGGQRVYIARNGALSYTPPGSGPVPAGSMYDQFRRQAPADGQSYGRLSHRYPFIACPSAGQGEYQVFVQVPNQGFNGDCKGFELYTVKAYGPGAWQYSN